MLCLVLIEKSRFSESIGNTLPNGQLRHRKTVRRYIERGLEPPAYTPRPTCISKIAAFEAYLREHVVAYPKLTASRLHRELRDLGFAGGYTTVKVLLRTIRPGVSAGFEVRFETPPGGQAQVDFAHFRTVFTDEPGFDRVVWLFSLVLGHSRMLWGRFVPQQDMQTVLHDGEQDGIVYKRALLDLARHYGFFPKACQLYRANTKGQVERPFRYIREDFFLARSFRNLADLNDQLRRWLDGIANPRLHATTRRVVNEAFAEEPLHLRPLPLAPFQSVLRLERRISRGTW